MKFYNQSANCLECRAYIDERVYHYSLKHFNIPLCLSCQNWIRDKSKQTSLETIRLYFALKLRGISADLEFFDGYKTIDISVVDARVNIEVDGYQHHCNCKQALSDLKRTYYSLREGYLTLRIPNALVNENLEETADCVAEFLNLSKENIKRAS